MGACPVIRQTRRTRSNLRVKFRLVSCHLDSCAAPRFRGLEPFAADSRLKMGENQDLDQTGLYSVIARQDDLD